MLWFKKTFLKLKKKKMEQHVRRTHVPENTDSEQPISTETLLCQQRSV